MDELIHGGYIAAEIRRQLAQEQQEFNLFAQLKPRLFVEGKEWCVIYGDNRTGIAGFGKSPHLAIMDFNAQWYKSI